MITLLLVIGVNLVVFGATAISRARKGLKPFAGNQPLPPEQRTMTFTLATIGVVAGVVLLGLSYVWMVNGY